MIKICQTIGLENYCDYTDYSFFKTESGNIGFYNFQKNRWCLFESLEEVEIIECPYEGSPELKVLNGWVRNEMDEDIKGFFNGKIEVKESQD